MALITMDYGEISGGKEVQIDNDFTLKVVTGDASTMPRRGHSYPAYLFSDDFVITNKSSNPFFFAYSKNGAEYELDGSFASGKTMTVPLSQLQTYDNIYIIGYGFNGEITYHLKTKITSNF